MIFFIAATHGAILGFLVAFHKKFGRPQSNKILGTTILFFSLCLAEYGLYTSGLYTKVPHLIASTNIFLFLVPPLLYFYIKSRLLTKINQLDYLSFVPVVFYLILAIPFYILSYEKKLSVITAPENPYIIFHKIWFFYYLVLWIVFGSISLKLISSKQKKIGTNLKEKKELKWLKHCMIIFMSVAFLDVGFYFLGDVISDFKITTAYITTSIHALLIYMMGYLVILNPKILFDQKPSQYEHSSLSDTDSKRLSNKIIDFMEKHKPYLDNNLRMGHLAEQLSISTNQLSQVLNKELNRNFNEFVNEYRVKEVKKRLGNSKYSNLTIIAIAEDCGFNSKNAFNRAFKTHTGKTPSQFKKGIQKNSGSILL